MFNSSINVRLKSLFDRIYISRNVFEKMKLLISSLEEGSHSYDILLVRANELINLVNNIVGTIDGLTNYNDKITAIQAANTAYVSNFNAIVQLLIYRYTLIIDKLLTDIENDRAINEVSDRLYKTIPGTIPVPYETPVTDASMKFFIPTDDIYPWNTITKSKILGTNELLLFSDDIDKIDPLGEDMTSNYSGGVESKQISRTPILIDILVNVVNSGFALSTINPDTGDIYNYIEDDYALDIVPMSKDIFFNGERFDDNGIFTTKPKPGIATIIKEFEECDISVRRHGEFTGAPTKFTASIK